MGDIPDSDIRLVQVARMLELGSHTVDAARARAEISARPADFAAALFGEAAANDDVTSMDAALEYLETRLADFRPLLAALAEAATRVEFARLLGSWR